MGWPKQAQLHRQHCGLQYLRSLLGRSKASGRLTRGYSGVIVVTLSLLGKRDSVNDLELVFVCFEQDFHRRNFRVRYEGKPIPNQD